VYRPIFLSISLWDTTVRTDLSYFALNFQIWRKLERDSGYSTCSKKVFFAINTCCVEHTWVFSSSGSIRHPWYCHIPPQTHSPCPVCGRLHHMSLSLVCDLLLELWSLEPVLFPWISLSEMSETSVDILIQRIWYDNVKNLDGSGSIS
jgi:hypothetical protein